MKKTLLLLPVFLIACSSSQEVEFEKSTGQANTVAPNSRFHINLSEDHKVGSDLWSVDHDYDNTVVSYVNSIYNSSNGGNVNFNFEALEAGKTEIHYTKSFARDTLEKVTFVVEVK